MLEVVKRKSVKKLKLEVELKYFEDLVLLVFILPKPYFKICIGAINLYNLEDCEEISQRVNAIFKNATGEYTYCLPADIIRELNKQEKNLRLI